MENTQTILDQELTPETISRRKLLPWWMKAFSWIFMVFAVFIPVGFVAAIIFNMNPQIAMYGIETTDPLSLIGIILSAIYLLKGAVGFGLWFEKDWAITAGLVDAAIGIIACVYVMFVVPLTENSGGQTVNFRLEILFVGLFLFGLLRVRGKW